MSGDERLERDIDARGRRVLSASEDQEALDQLGQASDLGERAVEVFGTVEGALGFDVLEP